MKYIRIKDKIIKLSDEYVIRDGEAGLPFYGTLLESISGVIAEADTIEALCDGFWWENKDYRDPIFISNKGYLIDRINAWKQSDKELNTDSLSKITVYTSFYIKGTGWVHTAKMKGVLPNGEIDWELL